MQPEAGGVRLNVANADEARRAYADILDNAARATPRATLDGVLVAPMVRSTLELIAGVHTDPCFGPMVLLGLGGIWAEALGDVAMRLAPLTAADVADMAAELRGARLLGGARLTRVLLILSDIALAAGGALQGIDINPLAVRPSGEVVVVDASLFLAS